MKINIALAASKQRPTAWVVVYHMETRKCLMLKRAVQSNNPGLWNFPGGGVDDQDVAKAAKRELLEEAGVKVKKSDMVKVYRDKALNATYYVVIVAQRPTLRIDPKESSGFRWMSVSALERMTAQQLHKKSWALVHNAGLRALLLALSRAARRAVKGT